MSPRAQASCCIVGAGPAGMMLGYLLARSGITVTVLEKHGDFLRDFRGDTVHPSTLEVIDELGLLDEFLQLPHRKARQITAYFGTRRMVVADFSRLRTPCGFIALLPQWDFLNFLASKAQRLPNFSLRMNTEATNLLFDSGRVRGIQGIAANDKTTPITLTADLVVACDGRHSILRQEAGLKVKNLGAPIDVLWLRLARTSEDPEQPQAHIDYGRLFVMLDRGTYWQCGLVIPKGGAEAVRARGLPALCAQLRQLAPFLGNRTNELTSWEDIKLLTVTVDRLETWAIPGLLCIGDAAHAMSPIGGVGINLAIQDAVAAAKILGKGFAEGPPDLAVLNQVQDRRLKPTKLIQTLQVQIQNRFLSRILASDGQPHVPLAVRLLNAVPPLRALPARLIGLGYRREHVHVEVDKK